MLKEFFEALQAQVGKSTEPKKIAADLGPRHSAWVINGQVMEFETPSPPLNYTAETYDDFIRLCRKFPVELILISTTGVVAYLSAEKRLDQLSWNRKFTPAFTRLLEWLKGKDYDQRGLVALLRNELRDAGGAVQMLAAVRNLKFSESKAISSSVGGGEESIGLEALSKMTGASELLERLDVDAAVYVDEDQETEQTQFTLLIDPLPAQKLIRLQSLEDELQQAISDSRKLTKVSLAGEFPEATVILGA